LNFQRTKLQLRCVCDGTRPGGLMLKMRASDV
jgi:hypothetical protein